MVQSAMPIADSQIVAALIRRVAEAVVMPRFKHLQASDIREKRPGDLVTLADTEAEAELSRLLRSLLPGSTVVGEEGVAADPSILSRLDEVAPVWLIDPIDGTRNFVHGRPRFAVMVALVVGGETVQGWIYDPFSDRMAIAEKGGGSRISGRRMTIAPGRPLSRLSGTAGWRHPPALGQAVARLVRTGCAGHDYLALLEDGIQFAYFRRLNPWDHAAGELLHREAGGHAGLLDGGAYRPLPLADSLLLAPDAASWARLKPLLA
jgi:fructose-1,6-bisphosphatase/inositol monophosphatase family enzyme